MNSQSKLAREMSSSGSIIAGMEVRGAILLAYDTRTHKNRILYREWDVEERELVEVVNNKVYLAQYCALAAAGNRGFAKKLHARLLSKVTEGLTQPGGPLQVKASDAMEFLRSCVLAELNNPADMSRAEYLVTSCRLILGMWEMNERGVFTPKLLSLDKDRVVRDVKYCALGNYDRFAETVLRENYHENMSVREGKDLLVRAIRAACFKDYRRILGGSIEVCVLMPRDYTVLPLSRRQQNLDRAITFFNAAIIPEEEREQR